jgi:hypothetical protein
MNRLLLVLFSCFSCFSNASEHPLKVSHMQSYSAEYDYYARDADGTLQPAGSWSDAIRINDDRIVRTVTRKPLGGDVDLVRTVSADKKSLSPLHLTQRSGPGLTSVYHSQLKDAQLVQILISDTETPARIMTSEFPTGVVEVNLQGLFAAALPFESTTQVSVTGYRGGANPSAETQVFDILGQEKIKLDQEEVVAWRIHQPQTGWTYWVRREPPYLLKVTHPSPDGRMLVSLLTSFEL